MALKILHKNVIINVFDDIQHKSWH